MKQDAEFWRKIFSEFPQVDNVLIDSVTNHLNIHVHGRILRAEINELKSLCIGYPHDIAASFLKKNGIRLYYNDTLVAYFDIQGYSAYLESVSIEQAIQEVSPLLKILRRDADTDGGAVKFDSLILSDSIICVIDTNRHPLCTSSLSCFFWTCSMFLYEAVNYGFPMRGAIGGGNFFIDQEIMISTALVDAVSFEKKQNWLGAMLTPKTIELIEKAKEFEIKWSGKTNIDLDSEKFKPYVRYGDVHFKNEEILRTHYIKPSMNDRDWTKRLKPFFDQIKAEDKIKNSNPLYAED